MEQKNGFNFSWVIAHISKLLAQLLRFTIIHSNNSLAIIHSQQNSASISVHK
jgi:hypothetical protein